MSESRSPALAVSLPIILCGKDAPGELFLEKTTATALDRSGATIRSQRELVVGETVKFLLADQKGEFCARVVWAGESQGEWREAGLEMEPESRASWGQLFRSTALQETSERLAGLIRELVQAAVEQARSGVPVQPAPDSEHPESQPIQAGQHLAEAVGARLADFEARLSASAEQVWQELGRRFTTAGVTYEKRMNEVAEARATEFEAHLADRLEERLASIVNAHAAEFEVRLTTMAEKIRQEMNRRR